MYRFISAFLLLSFTVICGHARNGDVGRFENRVRDAYAKTYHATVKLTRIDSLGNESASGSGVVVTADGLILTVAHVNDPGGLFRVLFPDGRTFTARGLGSIQSFDAGMMRIQEEGAYPFAPLGRSANLKQGEPCIALGYAGGLRIDQPALRLGFVVSGDKPSQSPQRRRVQTTCLMEPGDSGGPVFDLDGRLIGLRTTINGPLDYNFEVPVDVFLEYWDFLLSGRSQQRPPADARSSVPEPPALNPDNSFVVFSDTTSVLIAHGALLPEESYTVTSKQGDTTVYATCTPLRADALLTRKEMRKKSCLLGKSSIVGADPIVRVPGGSPVKAQVVYRDTARDLVLLEIPVRITRGLIDVSAGVERPERSQVGTFLYSVLPDRGIRMSVAGSVPFAIENRSRGAYLGVALGSDDDGIFFALVAEGSPAQSAGIETGQRLVSIDGIRPASTGEFTDIIKKKRVGDTALLEYMGGDSLMSGQVTLSRYPVVSGTHTAERFEGGKSIIRDGFGCVFTHDARIRPEECGSPVVDSEGRLYGINIARISRTATLVMPVIEIKAFLDDYLSEMRKAG